MCSRKTAVSQHAGADADADACIYTELCFILNDVASNLKVPEKAAYITAPTLCSCLDPHVTSSARGEQKLRYRFRLWRW